MTGKRLISYFSIALIVQFLYLNTSVGQIFKFRSFDLRHGLLNSEIHDISMDSDGFMLLATANGAYRFNGHKFELIKSDSKSIRKIQEVNGTIYLSSKKGVEAIDLNGNSRMLLANQDVRSVFVFKERLSILTDNGLYRENNDSLVRVHSSFTKKFHDAFLVDSALWLTTDVSGIEILTLKNGDWSVERLDATNRNQDIPKSVRGIAVNEEGEIWLASLDRGIQVYEGEQFYPISYEGIKGFLYSSIEYDPYSKSFWCGTWGDGLVNISRTTFQVYNKTHGLPDNVVSTLHMMNDGKICVGSLSYGIALFSPNGIRYFNEQTGLASSNVRDIQGFNDAILISTLGGLYSWDGISLDTLLSDERVGAMVQYELNMYISTYNGGAYKLDLDNKLTKLPLELGTEILTIASKKDKLYLGTINDGLYSYDLVSKEVYHHNTIPNKLMVSALYSDKNALYIGTERGMYTMDYITKKTLKLLPNDPVFSNIKVNQIDKEFNKAGIVIASESEGVFLYVPTTNKTYDISSSDGLLSNACRAFAYDDYDLVLATNIDVSAIRFDEDGGNDIHSLINITEVGNREINPGAIYFDNENLWIGTGFGAVNFNTDVRLSSNAGLNLSAKISAIESNVSTIDINSQTNRLVFPNTARWIKFEIQPANYNTQESTVNVRIVGLDDSWTVLEGDFTAFFKNIKPGNYTIEYFIEDGYGNKSKINTLDITVDAPYWQNWTFLAAILSGTIALFALMMFLFRPKTEKVERSVYLKQTVLTSRLIMFFGAFAYPMVSYLVSITDETIIDQQLEISIFLGAILLILGFLSFVSKLIKDYLPIIIVFAYTIIVSQNMIVVYINNLVPAHIIGVTLLIAVGSVIFGQMKHMLLFGLYMLIGTIWISNNVVEPYFNPNLFIVVVLASLLISVLLIGVRLSLLNRFEVSDSIINNINSLVLVANKNNDIIYASQSIKKELGYRQREVLGSGWWRIRGKSIEEEQVLKNNSLLYGNERAISYKSPILTKSGEKRYYRWVDTPIQGGYVAGIGYDVTEQHKLETELEKLSIAAKHSQTGIVISNANFEIEWVNESFEAITGYSADELIGNRPSTILKADQTSSELIELCRTDKLHEGYNVEMLNYKKDGSEVWLNITGNSIANEQGDIIQIVEIVQDISDRKAKELRLEQLSLVASETDNYVIITDREDRVLWTNKAFTEIFGYDFEDVEGMKVAEFLSTEILNPDEIKNIRQTVFEEKNVYEGEFCDKTKSGNIIWISATVTPVLNSKEDISYSIAVGSDITARKINEFQMEQVSKSNALMHGIDSILINENDDQKIVNQILELMMSLNNDFRITSFIEFIRAERRCRLLYLIGDQELVVVEDEDVSDYNSMPTLKKGNTFVVDNILDLDSLSDSDKFLLFNGVKSYLMTPIIIENELRGVIGVGSRRPHGFSENDVETYQNIANSIAVVLMQREQSKIISDSEENFRQLNESISEAFWLSDFKTGEVRYVNKVFEKLFGISQEELLKDPKKWTKNIHKEDRPNVIRQFKKKAALGKFNETYRVVVNDKVKWIKSTVYPIRNSDGELIKMSGSSMDVTKAVLREKDIMDLNKQLKSINTINQAVLLNENISEPLVGIIETIFDDETISRINILRYDFDEGTASFHYKRVKESDVFVDKLLISDLSSTNLGILKKGESVKVENIQNQKELSGSDKEKAKHGTKAYFMYPLMHNNELIGSLNIGFNEPTKISDYQNSFLDSLSNGISIAIYQSILLETIEKDKAALETINKDVSDSINYAKKFQVARLPDLKKSLAAFEEYGLWHSPRDIVSGDFYWTHESQDNIFIAVADCTGHGVPGAFMTLLFNTLLEKTVIEKSITKPNEILKDLHKGIKEYFKSKENISDGMDIVMIVKNKHDNSIVYAGAKRPLLVYRHKKEKFETYTPNLISIGEKYLENVAFDIHAVDYDKGDVFYMYTDGIVDQFGGTREKKFGKKRLVQEIKIHHAKPAAKQANLVKDAIINWMDGRDQLDDILLMVIRM